MIPVNNFDLSGNEKKYLNQCIDTSWISSEGPFIKKFEEEFSSFIGMSYGTAVCNGSAALDVAIAALNLNPGDEVIVPSFTIISPLLSVLRNNLQPVLVDSELETWNIDVSKIESKISKKTKAIIVVHIYGLPANLEPIIELCEKYELILIEDAAEVHGLEYNNRKCGSFGAISTFSFYPNKIITSGEGGMILTNSIDLKSRADKLRNLAFEIDKPRFIHYEMGWNYRMTNLQAAIGLAQFERIEKNIKRKKEIGKRYYEELGSLKQFTLQPQKTSYSENIYWVFGLLLKSIELKLELISALEKNSIGWRPFFYPMHLQPVFVKKNLFADTVLPNSERLGELGLYIPSGLGLTIEDQTKVIEVIKGVFE